MRQVIILACFGLALGRCGPSAASQPPTAVETSPSANTDDAQRAEQLSEECAALFNAGKLAEAEAKLAQILEIRRRIFKGADHPDIARSLNYLAGVRNALGRSADAEPLYLQALEMRQRLYKGDHPDVAASLNNLAVVRQKLSRSAEAETLYVQALEMRQRLYKGDHSDVATSLNELAFVRDALGRSVEAEPLYEQALAMRRRLFKDADHPDIARSLNYLAYVRGVLGRYAEAEQLYVQALAMRRRLFNNADHPDVAASLSNVALIRGALGRTAEAEPLYELALAMRQRLFEGDHPDVATSLHNLALVRGALGREAEAVPLHEQALAMRERLFKVDHPDVAQSLTNLANVRKALGGKTDALHLYERALEMNKRLFVEDHPAVADSLIDIAYALQEISRDSEAISRFQDALAIYRRMYGRDHPDIARTLNGTGKSLVALGRRSDAEPLVREALSMRQRLFQGDHPMVEQSLANLATILDGLARGEEAVPLLKQALAMRGRLGANTDDPTMLNYLRGLAWLQYRLRQWDDAGVSFEQTIAMRRRLYGGGDRLDEAADIRLLAYTAYARGNVTKADSLYGQAISICQRIQDNTPKDQDGDEFALWFTAGSAIIEGLGDLADVRLSAGEWLSSAELHAHVIKHRAAFMTFFMAKAGIASRATAFSHLSVPARQLRRLPFAPGSTVPASDGYAGMLWYKGVMTEASRAERGTLFALGEVDPAARTLLDEQIRLQRERALLASPLRPEALTEAELARLQMLDERLTSLDRQIRDNSAEFAERAQLAKITVKDVANSLATAQALVEYAVFRPLVPNPDQTSQRKFIDSQTEHYAAFVLRPDASAPDGYTVVAVDLGERAAIDDVVSTFRSELEAFIKYCKSFDNIAPSVMRARETRLAETTEAIRTLVWDPLTSHLRGTTRAYISPDARLHEVPFEALPSGKDDQGRYMYLAESLEIVYQTGGRELARAHLAMPMEPSNTAVLVGDPLFDADQAARTQALAALFGVSERRAANPAEAGPHAQPAVGEGLIIESNREPALAERIATTLGSGGGTCEITWKWTPLQRSLETVRLAEAAMQGTMQVQPPLTGAAASKPALLATLERHPRPRVLQLATHGFYCTQAPATAAPRPSTGAMGMLSGRDEPVAPDPMLRSMLILAGADIREPGAEDNGLLSASEVMALDLRGTEVVGLTACHSGQGQLQAGEGVAGLRMAFTVAGARSILQSLWEVPAKESLEQTEGFYASWLRKNQTRYGAFRSAQLEALKRSRETTGSGHPWLWAGFTFAGDPGDLPPNTQPAPAPKGTK